jgi:C_GCAxxG_C_C family probable redox protein
MRISMGERAERAIDNFEKGFNCSQAVLSAFAEDLGLDCGLALKVSSGFGGGIGRGGDVCGAVTGAIMALGLRFMSLEEEPLQAKLAVYKKVQEFKKKYKKKNGSILCRELVGCDISTDEGFKMFIEKDLHNKVCAGLVRDAVEIVEKLKVKAKNKKRF